ncbi:MAG: vitamin K epoxide reductase family protein [Limnohabitans sp.]|nr:vitamin K epoxide reductase family protein [Limnohabitans sp.]
MAEKFPFLFQYLKKEKITIDQAEFLFQIESHSEYPSLLAISDTLSFFNIENLATKLDFDNIFHLPKNFVALLKTENNKPFLTLVEKSDSGFKYYNENKEKSVSEAEFKTMYQDVVLLAEKEVENVTAVPSKFNTSILLGIALILYILFLFVTKSSTSTLVFSCLSLMGIYFSIEAILKEIGIETTFSASVCTISASSDCDAVIKSKGLNFLEKFNYSNFSITFFITQFILLFVSQIADKTDAFLNFQFYLLLLSVPVTFLSIYHQTQIAKKWCTICLLIIGLLYIQIGTTYFSNPSVLKINNTLIISFLFLFTVMYFIVNSLKESLKIKNEQKSELSTSYRFKRNYELFKLALTASNEVNVPVKESSLVVGNPASALKIAIVTNPFCGFCKDAHQIIEGILKTYKNEVCITIQFNYNIESKDEKSKDIHHKFIEIYFTQGQEPFMKALHNWFENKIEPDVNQFALNELRINEILNQQYLLNQRNNINFTPCIIVSNKIFPKMYDRKDLIYFIPELINEVEIV